MTIKINIKHISAVNTFNDRNECISLKKMSSFATDAYMPIGHNSYAELSQRVCLYESSFEIQIILTELERRQAQNFKKILT